MGLSRLDNFLKSARGTILYVNPNDLDATDSVENQGNSLTRPFKTIQRALIESSRFSYQRGLNNDRFGKTTILLYPGEHAVDNRPGYIPDGSNNYKLRSGSTTNDLPAWDNTTNFDLDSPDNELYKLNSVFGGVVVPRGTSLVGMDLRKTKIRPKYVPSPTNDNIEKSAIFRVTGGCYFWQLSIFDADPNGTCYVDYTTNTFVPNFSHHKLTCFEYCDGVNGVDISDEFLTFSTTRTDLDMYYEKVGLVYGQSSGRAIEPDYPSAAIDIQPKVDEYRIVGPTGASVGITSIKAGDGVTATTTITVTTASYMKGLDVDTPFHIQGITATGYNGQFVVSDVPADGQIKYTVQNAPDAALPSVAGATLALTSDTVTSSSPYIFNTSLRSVYGMCGLLADGDKATGFKSMVAAQFTGIGLQKDDNAFIIYNNSTPKTGAYDDNTNSTSPLSTNSRAVHKPSYRNYHIRVVNDAVVQLVSTFAIGYAEHFAVETGGDISMTNSNSNFGSHALAASGFKRTAFGQDDKGYITSIIPPKEVPLTENSLEFELVDVNQTGSAVGVGSTAHLYLYGQKNKDVPPENVIEGYRVGAKENDSLKVLVSSAGSITEYGSRIVMPGSEDSAEKIFTVKRSVTGINSIGSNSAGGNPNVITFTAAHTLINGESVRILSNDGHLPDGLDANNVYYAIAGTPAGLSTNTNIKVAKTLDDAVKGNALSINDKGGLLKVVSRVSDKNSGDIGHPIQFDTTQSQWYVKVSSAATDNQIYSTIVGLGSTGLGAATPKTFVRRRNDARSSVDTLYRARYVVPKDGGVARPPSDGFIIQESNTSIGSTDVEIQTYFGTGSLANANQQRNFRVIAGASWDGVSSATIATELPHNLTVGSEVKIENVKSSENTTATDNTGYNRNFSVTGISSTRGFAVGLTTDPGTFSNDISTRTTALPSFKKKRYSNTYYIYRTEESQPYVSGEQDGVYYLTLANASNAPTVTPFQSDKFSQPIKELYPQTTRDNPVSDPAPAESFAVPGLIGQVVLNDVRKSLTKETLDWYNRDVGVGVGITNITSTTGVAHTITTVLDHGLNRVTKLSVVSGGAGYGSGIAGDLYNASLVAIGSSTTGENATAKITFNGSGTITAVQIMDGGSAYGIGNTLAVTGVTTSGSFTEAVLKVDAIYNNVNDVINIIGISSESYAGYNNLHRITGVNVGWSKTVTVESTSTLSGFSTITGIGATLTANSYFYNTGEAVRINTLSYNNTTGIATVTTHNNHGLKVDSKVKFTGAGQAVYNGNFVITENISLTSFSVNIGVTTQAPTATGTIYAYREGFASNSGNITVDNENLNGRMVPTYAGITTTISTEIVSPADITINVTNLSNLNVNIGDYLAINDEIVRVKTTVGSGAASVTVFRGLLGSKAANHPINSTLRKIFVNPVELRRHSIVRASGHTFEYVGYGPGNYSTAFPDKQDRQISFNEELLAQSIMQDGGVNFYTGMNDQGVSYAGNKKLSTLTGKEEIFGTPIPTVEGEDIGNLPGLNINEATESSLTRSIKIEGGPDNKIASEFNGPVIFNNKITSNSDKGIEAQSYYVQGDQVVSRKHTLSDSKPDLAGNPGDITYQSDPSDGGYTGWIYSSNNEWRRFGGVSNSSDFNVMVFDQVGIGTTTPGDLQLQVGSGSSIVAIDGNGVGIGTTANTFKLHVNGNTNIIGTCAATYFSGDGSGLTDVSVPSSGWTNYVSSGSTLTYNTSLSNIGIGTTAPRFNLELGSIGSATTSIYAHGEAKFVGMVTATNTYITGIVTAKGYLLDNVSSGTIYGSKVGLGTNNPLQTVQIGLGNTTDLMVVTGIGSVGIGTTIPKARLDVQGHTKLKTYSESVGVGTVYANEIRIDLSTAQTFECTVDDNVTGFRLYNIPTDVTSFTLKVTQDTTGSRNVGIDTFYVGAGATFPVYWPGGLVPIVTPTASKSDVYSFKIFDGTNISTVGMFGVIGGQNYG